MDARSVEYLDVRAPLPASKGDDVERVPRGRASARTAVAMPLSASTRSGARPSPRPLLDSTVDVPPSVVLGAALGKLDRAVLVVDLSGRLCFANPAAQHLVAADDAVGLRQQRIAFKDAVAHGCFERYLRTRKSLELADELVLDTRRSGTCGVLRVVASAVVAGSSCWIVLVIFDPCGAGHLSTAVLREMYGLTAAESALVARLYAGDSPAEAAQVLGITVNTARCHLKHVFDKCDVHSQAALLKMLALGPAAR